MTREPTFPDANVANRADLDQLSEAVADLTFWQRLEEVEVEEGHLWGVVGADWTQT